MGIFTDTTYFVKDINLPTGTYSNLTNEIAKYEPEILTRLLGAELYDLVQAESADPASAPERLKDIILGKEYTVSFNGRNQKVFWNGLVNDEKISLISYYVYYHWQRNNVTKTSNVSETAPQSENAMRAVWANKSFSAWRRLRALYGWTGQNSLIPSLYNFLIENEATYPEWVFTPLGSLNNLDL